MFTSRFPALATRDARIFYLGQFLSLVGTWMQNTVQPYVAYRISGQPIYLGLVGFSSTLPTLLFTLWGGVLVERVDKRKLIIFLQAVMMIQAFMLAALTVSGLLTIWHIIVLAFVLGTANSIEITARQSWFVELVGRAALPNAIALQSSVFNVARVIGPAISAPFLLAVQNGGEGWAFFANGVSYFFVIIGLLSIRSVRQQPNNPVTQADIPAATPARPSTGLMSQFREGQSYIRHSTLMMAVVVMAATMGILGFTVLQQLPVFARDVLGQPNDPDALVAARNSALAAAQGVGALVASLLLTLSSKTTRQGLMLSIGQFVFCFALLGLGLARQLPVAVLMMVLIGWGSVTMLASMNTLIQLTVPNALRGRVFSTYLWALQGSAPLGSLLIGGLAQRFGASFAAVLSAVGCLLIFTVVHWRTSVVRQFRVERS